jgi:glutamate-1-semialdehyde 2,1-aminomutase
VALQVRAKELTPGGVHSNVRLQSSIFFERGAGARLWDVDGNEYVDFVLGQGPNYLGHANAAVNSAVHEACRSGMVFGSQHAAEIEAADVTLAALGWAERIRFGMTGTECVQAALRLSRAATGRRLVIQFEGHYHGWLDNVLTTMRDGRPGPASRGQDAVQLSETVIVRWNDVAAIDEVFASRGDEIAAVIMEPMMVNVGAIDPRRGYLEHVRSVCDRHGTVLIFDEVITGFRLALGGAAETFGVTPDLATYGKAMAGGWPVAALAGRAALMDLFADGGVNHSGTFNASVMSTAAVIATQRILATDPPYARVASVGARLMAELADVASATGLQMRVQGRPAAFHMSFGAPADVFDFRSLAATEAPGYPAFADLLIDSGVWVAKRGVWYVSAAHTDDDVDAAVAGFSRAASIYADVTSSELV